MKIRSEQFTQHLSDGLKPVYLFSGDEPLLLAELQDSLRQHARSLGFTERKVFDVDRYFDWNQLQQESASMSLFSEQRLIELRLASIKPGKDGAPALIEYCQNPASDTVLVLSGPKSDKAATNTKWFKAIDNAGVVVQVWPVAESEFSVWLGGRMRKAGLQPDKDALMALEARVEGNLLAANQEIEKLLLQHGEGAVSAQDIESMVGDNARFNVFKLVDAALLGKEKKALRILAALRLEGIEAVVVNWALAREIRSLHALGCAIANGADMAAAMSKARVWGSRQGIVRSAVSRHDEQSLSTLLNSCALADRAAKGRSLTAAWDVLLGIVQGLSSHRANFSPAVARSGT